MTAFCADNTVIVAGSTWEEDEEELDHYANTHPDIRFIIAPHEIEEDHLKDMEDLIPEFRPVFCIGKTTVNHQSDFVIAQAGKLRQPNVLIIDNIGMLAQLYYYAHICYVGGGFGDDGVHNTLEAAVYGKPVITGPVIEKYIEVMETGRSRRCNHY